MGRQLPLLRGLAILAVVCNHATGWGYTAMFWWVHRYRQVVAPPCYDQMGTPIYYGLVLIQQLALFSIPAFLFISGFFIAYAARGSQPAPTWKMIRARIMNLLWPYLVWSLVIYASDLVESELLGGQKGYSLGEFLKRLALGNVSGAYFFVLLLFQLYLLSPIVTRLGKERSDLLLVISALVQLTMTGLLYLLPDEYRAISDVGGGAWLFVWGVFYFSLGVVCAFHYKRIKLWLARFKWGLLGAVVILGALSILESEVLYRSNQNANWARGPHKFSSFLYAVAFILFFLALDKVSITFVRTIERIGSQSYGIYLVHGRVMEFVARVIYHIAPWLLAQQVLFQPILVVLSMGIPLVLMTGVAKSPAKRFYRYAFG